tara:strand:- start:3766 stop:4320 length:555 start_codon:yes stop_codon:yes gene_type:complete
MAHGDNESELEWSDVSEETARAIMLQGEEFLRSQLQTSIAADQRAMTGASIFVGFAGVVLAMGLAHWSESEKISVLVPLLIGSLFFLGASACGFYAARPVDFYYPGSHPELWWPVRNAPLNELLGGQTENLQQSIALNDTQISTNQLWLKRGMIMGMLAPIASVVSFLFFSQGAGCLVSRLLSA